MKKRKENDASVESPSAIGESSDHSKKTRLEEGDGVAGVLNERSENGKLPAFLNFLSAEH